MEKLEGSEKDFLQVDGQMPRWPLSPNAFSHFAPLHCAAKLFLLSTATAEDVRSAIASMQRELDVGRLQTVLVCLVRAPEQPLPASFLSCWQVHTLIMAQSTGTQTD